MKITKKNGRVVVYDDEKVVNSIMNANAGVEGEKISRTKACAIADEVFARLTAHSDIISTGEVRDCVAALLREKNLEQTAQRYLDYKKS